MNVKSRALDQEASKTNIYLVLMMAVVLIVLAVIGYWSASEVSSKSEDYAALITLVFALVGIGGSIVLLIGLAIILSSYKLSYHPYALALPQGSVRAVLALSLVVIFMAVSVYLVGMTELERGAVTIQELKLASSDDLAELKTKLGPEYAVLSETPETDGTLLARIVSPGSGAVRADLAKQIFTTIATVLVTVIGFYFGSRSSATQPEAAAEGLLITGQKMATQTKLSETLEVSTKVVGEVEQAAIRADKAVASAEENLVGAPDKIAPALEADLIRLRKANAEAGAALTKARSLLTDMMRAKQAAEEVGAGKPSADEARATFERAMAELKLLTKVAESAAAKAEKIASRSSALKAKVT